MTKAIYLVSSGHYSSYRVHMALESEDLAKAYCERENPFVGYSIDAYFVEPLELLSCLPYEAYARINSDGTIRDSGESQQFRTKYDELLTENTQEHIIGIEVYRLDSQSALCGTVIIRVRATSAEASKTRRDELVIQYMRDPASAPIKTP